MKSPDHLYRICVVLNTLAHIELSDVKELLRPVRP